MARKQTPGSRKRSPAATERARQEWLRRVEAEYRSAAITQELTLWLIRIAASPDLILDGLRIVKDELKHAELSHIVYTAGGGSAPPQIVRESLGIHRRAKAPLEHDVLRASVEVFCLGETVAVRLFRELRSKCAVPAARRALDRILRDEVRQRDFGWSMLEWLSEHPMGDELVALIKQELPGMFKRLRASYAPVGADRELTIPDDERAWGLMPTAAYGQILEQVLERDYTPRFARFGIDAAAAWRAS
ncbi:MAG TPA: ferritin-like domain-containing protein [Polyangiaceae bacterium]|nr:ferritin-like domain-containing protein [Polyangiaceae bacterium]